jgi:hypothetical protein
LQEPVLFLCAVYDFENSLNPSDAAAKTIFEGCAARFFLFLSYFSFSLPVAEYIADRAPHSVPISLAVKKAIEKKLKAKAKVDKNLFKPAWQEIEQSLLVYHDYKPQWLKDKKIDDARRKLIREIDFDPGK